MDPVTAVQSALALAISIRLWLEAREEKEQVIRSISATTNRICDVLTPFNDESIIRKLDNSVISSFNGIKDVLFRTKEHLIAWGGKKPKLKSVSSMIVFFVPSQVTKALRQDEQDLNTQLVGMLFILAVNKLLKESSETGIQDQRSVAGSDQNVPPSYQEIYSNRNSSPQPPHLPASSMQSNPEELFDNPVKNAKLKPFWSENIRAPSPQPPQPLPSSIQPNPEELFDDSIRNAEVKQFWRDFIGAKVLWVAKGAFQHGLMKYTGETISWDTLDRMMFALDEFKLGGVTPTNLDRLVEETGGFENFLKAFQASSKRHADRLLLLADDLLPDDTLRNTRLEANAQDPRLPLLLWVDDNPHYNTDHMRLAEELGIHIVSVTSTVSAKEWIETNTDFLRRHDIASRIRVISDNARIEFDPHEPGGRPNSPTQTRQQAQYNFSAGENIIRYLRGHLYNLPVLIYCASSIPYTRYVEWYTNCGSTTSAGVVMAYIKALAEGRTDDNVGWTKFNAKTMSRRRANMSWNELGH